jgi:hypothetical protein
MHWPVPFVPAVLPLRFLDADDEPMVSPPEHWFDTLLEGTFYYRSYFGTNLKVIQQLLPTLENVKEEFKPLII